VVNSLTGEPVRKGILQLVRNGASGGPNAYSAQSDSSGKFLFEKVPPGRYGLSFNRAGFAISTYSGDSGRSPAAIILERAQDMTGIVFRVTPDAVVTGRVVDEDGDAVAYAQVQLSRFRYTQGRKVLMGQGSASTNDLGDYRIFDVPAGKYRLSVTPQQRYVVISGGLTGAQQPGAEEYVPTYYPGVADLSASAELDVAAGALLQNINVRLVKMRTVHVRGHITLPQLEGPQVNASIMLSSPDSPMPSRGSSMDRQGNFDIASILPGAYTLMVRVNQSGKPAYSTHLPLQVGASGVEGLAITVPAPVDLNGRVRAEGDDPIAMKNLRITLVPAELVPGSGSSGAAVKDDGSFHLENIGPDRYDLMVSGALGNRYVKAVRAGGIDALTNGLDLSSGSPGQIDVVLGANAGRITGVVNGQRSGQPVTGATAVLIPQTKERRIQTASYKVSSSGEDGRFTFTGIAPGDYRIFAWEQMPEDQNYMDPGFLKTVEDKGQPVTIHEGDRPDLQVIAIPPG
jgi:protocatechuate 3,4-dioxygenase beta subunit